METPSAYFKSKTWGLESEISSPEAEIPAMRPATCDHLGAALAADLIRSSKLSLSGEAALAADLIRSSKLQPSGIAQAADLSMSLKFSSSGEAVLAADLIRSSKFQPSGGCADS